MKGDELSGGQPDTTASHSLQLAQPAAEESFLFERLAQSLPSLIQHKTYVFLRKIFVKQIYFSFSILFLF